MSHYTSLSIISYKSPRNGSTLKPIESLNTSTPSPVENTNPEISSPQPSSKDLTSSPNTIPMESKNTNKPSQANQMTTIASNFKKLRSYTQWISMQAKEFEVRQCLSNALLDTDTSDISFDVKGQIFHAHLVILKAMAPDFVRTLNLEDHDASISVPISDVEPKTFQTMLKYIYGGTFSFLHGSDYAKVIIDASDKYGVENLKLAAEKSYVDNVIFTSSNVVEILLYADAKNCKVLRSKAMIFLMHHMDEIAASPSFADLYQSESITVEIMARQAKWIKKYTRS